MIKLAASVAAAAVIAGLVMFLTASAPRAELADAHGDLLAMAIDRPCSLTGWPFYEARCLHAKRSLGPAKNVRLIAMR